MFMRNSHNQIPTADNLEFLQPFDGSQSEVSPAERQAVARRFNSFVDDFMLQHIADVRNHNRNPEWPINVLEAEIPRAGGSWAVSVRHSVLSPEKAEGLNAHNLPDKAIDLYFEDRNGNERQAHTYGLGHDGVVRRKDEGDALAAERQAAEWGDAGPEPIPADAPAEVREALFARIFEAADQAQENEALEMDMGLSNQPIGMDELDALITFITSPQAVFKHRKGFSEHGI